MASIKRLIGGTAILAVALAILPAAAAMAHGGGTDDDSHHDREGGHESAASVESASHESGDVNSHGDAATGDSERGNQSGEQADQRTNDRATSRQLAPSRKRVLVSPGSRETVGESPAVFISWRI